MSQQQPEPKYNFDIPFVAPPAFSEDPQGMPMLEVPARKGSLKRVRKVSTIPHQDRLEMQEKEQDHKS